MPVTVQDKMAWLPTNVYGADVSLETLRLEPFAEKTINKKKLKKPLKGVPPSRSPGASMDWEAWFYRCLGSSRYRCTGNTAFLPCNKEDGESQLPYEECSYTLAQQRRKIIFAL